MLKNGGNLGSWSSGEDGHRAQEIRKREALKQDFKRFDFNMEKSEIKVRQSLMARLHLLYDAIH
jgi:hypothetical protein